MNIMHSEARRLSIDTSNQHLSTSFTYLPPRAVIFDLDSDELVSAIRSTLSSGGADIAIDFIQKEDLSGQQFVKLSDLKLEKLSDGNPNAFTELLAIRASLPNSLRALNSPAHHRPSIWDTFGEVEPPAVDVRLRYRQIISRALEDTTHKLESFDFGDDNDGHLSDDPNRNDACTGIPGRNSSIPGIFSSSGGAILGGRAILVNASQSTEEQVYKLPGFHQELRSRNLVIQKECHMGADEDFLEDVSVQMASVSSSVPMPIPNQEKAPDMGENSELPGGSRSDNRHVRRYDDLQAVYLDKQAIGDGLNVDSDIKDEIIGHEATIVSKDKNDGDDHGSLDIGRTNRLHGEWYLPMLPVLDADAARLSSASEIQPQEGDDVDFERRSQTPPPRDSLGRFGTDAAEGEKENPIGLIEANDLPVANKLTSKSLNILHNFVDLMFGADELVVFNDLVLVFIDQPYPSDLSRLKEHEAAMFPVGDECHQSTPYGDYCKLYLA